jgi:hypothetical protein
VSSKEKCLRLFREDRRVHTVLAKHSKNFSLEDGLAMGVDRMQRNFGPLKQQVEEWQAMQLSTASAKLLIYQAFIEDELGFPKHLARRVHDLYFQPVHEEFQPRTMWSLLNAFTSAVKGLHQFLSTRRRRSWRASCNPSVLSSAYRKYWRTVPKSCRLSQPIGKAAGAGGPYAAASDPIADLAENERQSGWPRRTFQVQNRLKPTRRQATTGSGLTMASDDGRQSTFPTGKND